MTISIYHLSNDAYTRLIELYGTKIFKRVNYDTSDGTYHVILDNCVIIKTGFDEVRLDLGGHCYYLSKNDFCTIEVF